MTAAIAPQAPTRWPGQSTARCAASAPSGSISTRSTAPISSHFRGRWRALGTAHAVGKIHAIGVPNHRPSQIEARAGALSVPIVSQQIELSPLKTGPLFDATLGQTMVRSMAVLAWSPFAGGRLANPSEKRERAVCALLDRVGEEPAPIAPLPVARG